MTLTPGTRLGPYEVTAQIGVGGMGEVYKATDTNLKRAVAIKVLPASVAGDAERLARFQREAEVLAALNHPNIAQIHGLEKSGGTIALVMELVEGPTLADRIALGAIPLDEALPIAKQIAEALEAAHEQGIIHRDLKPANIKVRPDGMVKVLDFGLAKAMEPTGMMAANASMLPTVTTPAMTQAGTILGTAAYMSPEQARGKAVDKRADIWAFGCVLYEMLTGTRAFEGEDTAETLGAVIHKEPVWLRLPTAMPASVRTVLQRCLQKDPRQRVRDIGDVHMALDGAFETTASPIAAPAVTLWQRRFSTAAAVLVTGIVVGGGVWLATRQAEPERPRVSRLYFTPSGNARLTTNVNVDRHLTVTPDGSRIAYVGNRGTQLFVRALDSFDPFAVYTGAPRGPFVSPDGLWIGFGDNNTVLKKVAVTGGPATTVTALDGNIRGAAWAPDDTIVFATSTPATGLQRVAAASGPTTILTRPDRAHGELDHVWPEMLPGGHAVLFTITATSGGLDAAQVAVLDMQTGRWKVLVRGGSNPQYVSSGHLVYAAGGALRAVAFDVARLETRGTPVQVVPDVLTTPAGALVAMVADDGTLAYMAGSGADTALRSLVWVNRQGDETPIATPPRDYTAPRLSPDGTRVAVYVADQEDDIWIWDLVRTTLTRFTFDPAGDRFPTWTPDGRRLIFSSERNGVRNLHEQAADGTGPVSQLTNSPNQQNLTGITPDGRVLVFQETTPKTGDDVMQVEMDGAHRIAPLVQSPFSERNGIVSPDGRWLAYEANDSGQYEVYVRPFPEVNGGHWQVSTAGGTRPLWSRSGEELFYVAPAGAIMGVGVQRAPSWAATTPTTAVKEGYHSGGTNVGRAYDIAPDDQRFLMITDRGDQDTNAAPPQIIVVQHWVEELKRLVPTQ